jgi:FecR protein
MLRKSLCLLALLVAGVSNAWSADGRILSFVGDVRINGKLATADTLLYSADTIATAAGASVRIVLSDNSVLDLDSDAQIQLSEYSYNSSAPKESKSEVNVVEGTLRYVSGLIAKENPDNISFTAGASTIGVRGTFTGIKVEGATVHLESMIGEATLTNESEDGKAETIVVPPGKSARTDPNSGETLVETSTSSNKVNDVVQAIAAAAPDARTRSATDEGCSEGVNPLRDVARPETDAETAAAIDTQLAALSEGELMMVMAVLINNSGHLCIDSDAVAATLARISSVRPESAKDVVVVAILLDPDNAEKFTESAVPPTSGGQQPPTQPSEPPINNEIPPGGGIGEPPSPE